MAAGEVTTQRGIMLRLLYALALGASFLAGAAALVLDGSGAPPFVETALLPVRQGGEHRFADIAGNAYSPEFRRNFTYGPPASAVLRWRREADTFRGELAVKGYKPNFAYQVKLVGLPEYPKITERIGFAGRWLLPGGGKNFTDEDYRALKDKSAAEGYLFFEWFVTDGNGDARVPLALDRSLHVLVNETLEHSPPPAGARVRSFRLSSFPAAAYGTQAPPPAEVGIWEMSEHAWSGTRPPPGETRLPPGSYVCLLRLTEESFHGAGGGGFWATASQARVRFRVTDGAKR